LLQLSAAAAAANNIDIDEVAASDN